MKYTHYLYLVFAIVFLFDAIMKVRDNEDGYPLSFFITAVCIFMFFFRRNFIKRLEERNKNQQ